ncbi:HAD family hydrolase [Streptosporangium sp. NPDC000396]|uniref:HAD family hydrolase n=1 Tax=Streptosporangium sp. NPDC000396 TaxID=3366185 RepID=UPI003677A9A0
MKWVVFDYAGVISLPPPEHAGALLPQSLDVAPERFWSAYWEDRQAYDLGAVDASRFWGDVCARLGADADADLLEILVALDLKAWTYLNPDTMTLLEELAGTGVSLALLSNAPVELARLIDDQPWAHLFRRRLFSADLQLVKPDPRAFRQTCERLGARPGDLLFVDDRQENVTAAEAAGIESVLFTDALRLRSDLARVLGGETTR